jgi:hypothetical protein
MTTLKAVRPPLPDVASYRPIRPSTPDGTGAVPSRPACWPHLEVLTPMATPITEAAASYRAFRTKLLADADQAATAIRRDLGLPRDRRRWHDHPGLWNQLNTEVVNRLDRARRDALAGLAEAKAETRRALYRVPVDRNAQLNRTMAEVSYRQAREYAMALPLGEVGVKMAMERMAMAEVVGDEAMMAALALLAEERGGEGGTVWERIPQRWAAASSSKYTRERLAELAEVEVAMRQFADPERFSMPRLTPLAPEPEPPPTLAPVPILGTLNGQAGGGDAGPAVE